MAILSLRAITVRRGDRDVVRDMSLEVERGAVVALMGPSGTGKSSVLRVIAGLDPLAGGTIEIEGVRLSTGAVPHGVLLRELHRRVGMVFQFHHLFAHRSALDNVWMAPVHVSGHSRAEAEARARALLAEMGVEARAAAFPHELSGGEAQRVAIARALAVDPPLLLMDEPTASLDQERREELARTLRKLAAQGRAVLVATHDIEFARMAADRAVILREGQMSAGSEVF